VRPRWAELPGGIALGVTLAMPLAVTASTTPRLILISILGVTGR
jgi:hypothetical protein